MSGDTTALIKSKAKCCVCEAPLRSSEHLNIVNLDKLATWEYPTWGNILIPGSSGRASAVVCDGCVRKRDFKVKYAVEVRGGEVFYHPVEELKDVPAITEEMVQEAEARTRTLSDFA